MRVDLKTAAIQRGECHIPFGLPATMQRSRAQDGGMFYCPNGHHIHYYEDENAKLKKQLARAEERANRTLADYNEERNAHEHTRHQLHGTKGRLVQFKRRVSRGVCPCCTRTFSNLERHIADVHPEYRASAE